MPCGSLAGDGRGRLSLWRLVSLTESQKCHWPPDRSPETPAASGVIPLIGNHSGLRTGSVGSGSGSPSAPPPPLTGASSGTPQGCCEGPFCSSPPSLPLPEPVPPWGTGWPSLGPGGSAPAPPCPEGSQVQSFAGDRFQFLEPLCCTPLHTPWLGPWPCAFPKQWVLVREPRVEAWDGWPI